MIVINMKAIPAMGFHCVMDGNTSSFRHVSIPAGVQVTIEKVVGQQVYIEWERGHYRLHGNIARVVFPDLGSVWQVAISI